jgi:hypothetical protein
MGILYFLFVTNLHKPFILLEFLVNLNLKYFRIECLEKKTYVFIGMSSSCFLRSLGSKICSLDFQVMVNLYEKVRNFF